ncbi:MAG: LptF/LptG family permease [Pirellulales bacterium]|nr:LptF/LptG family permease [Pirellulales bacterium]
MKIIDRYLLRQFLQVFLICFCSLTGLYIVFDAFSNLDEFMHYAEGNGSLLGLMGQFYAYRSIFFFDRTSGVLGLTAAMFTVTWIQRHNELTALAAAGIANRRVVMPVIVAAILISLSAACVRELVIPGLSEQLSRTPSDLVGTAGQDLEPRYDNNTDILIRGQATIAAEKRIVAPSFLFPPSLNYWGKNLAAENAYYQPPQEGRPGGYLFDKVTLPAGIANLPSISLADLRVVITPQDAPDWLKPDQCFVVSEVDFDQLAGGRNWRQFASTRQLIAGLSNPSLDYGADVRVAIHSRFVQPLLDGTLLFLGLPLIMRRDNRNVFLAVGMCVAVTSVFMLVVFGLQHLGAVYLVDPALAAWMPLMIFVPVAVAMSDPLRQ